MSEQEAKYFASGWRHLPSDRTMSEFLTAYYNNAKDRGTIPSQKYFRNALESIDTSEHDNILLKQLFPHWNNGKTESNNRKPNLIPWEAEDLLTKILQIRDNSKECKGTAFSEEILLELAGELEKTLDKDIKEDYVAIQYLSSDYIQDKLLQRFREPFSDRLNLLQEYIFNKESGVDITMLATILGEIDGLIAQFEDRQAKCTSPTQALYTLFENLTSSRENLLPEKNREDGVDSFTWSSRADAALVNSLESMIHNTERNRNEQKRDKFLKNYQQYLLALLPATTSENAHRFWSNYQILYDYFFSVEASGKFEKDVREELYQFAREIFNNLDYADSIELPYSTYEANNAGTTYVSQRIVEYHQKIQLQIHSALHLILAFRHFFYFLGVKDMTEQTKEYLNEVINCLPTQKDSPDSQSSTEQNDFCAISERYFSIAKAMEKQFTRLSRTHPEIPSVDFNDINSLNEYITLYRTRIFPIFHDEETEINSMVLMNHLALPTDPPHPRNRFARLWAMNSLLTMQCKLVVALEVEKAIPALVEEYSRICQKNRERKTEETIID